MKNQRQTTVRDDLDINPNSLHDFHSARRGPKNVPSTILSSHQGPTQPKDPGHPYATTTNIQFELFEQRRSNAPFGYEHFVSLPPDYVKESDQKWPLILFLHGAGESQRNLDETYVSIRHGIPKIILCYDKIQSGPLAMWQASIFIPLATRLRNSKQTNQGDRSADPVSYRVCSLVAENFITVTPSLNMSHGYGWNASILTALLDEIVDRYRVDLDRVHVTGFSMGGYGTWDLALQTPDRFASIMPICGGGDPLRANQLKHIPHWIHHGQLDDIIPVQASQQMVDALKKVNAPDLRFTVYPDLMHDSWTVAYSDPNVYQWMLATRRTRKDDEKEVSVQNSVS